MHVPTRSSIVSFALKTLTGAVASAVLVASANAAGLGKLTVLSSLGQPLRAEIELTAVSADEAGALVAKLAPADAFRTANIDFNPTLLSLRFEVEQRNGRQVIRVTSTQPVNEPFVDMLLELNWTGGRMVREYTFLLDPADMRATQSPQVAPPVDLSRNAAPAAAPAVPAASAPAAASVAPVAPSTPAPAPARQPAAKPAVNEYTVKSGDNLTRIANQVKPVDVSLDMMLVALYRANPEAFSGNNMNRLKSGQILAVPDADTIRNSAPEGEARGVVVAHAADFNAYRAKLAGQVANSTPAKEPDTTQNVSGKITAKVEEKPSAVNTAKDKLTLSKATSSAPVEGKTGLALEDKVARQKEMDEAAARTKELEKNVRDLENLMSVKNKAGAETVKPSASASASAAASMPASASVSAEASAPPKPKRTLVIPPKKLEPSLFETLMDNLEYVGLAGAGLLAAAGAFVASRRRKKFEVPKEEASILGDTAMPSQALIAEAGGQSVDTNNSVFNSNFAPSASQLDTNEVDPVAEADVYIAYGRDAQAEEILKEALRSHPERHAVRLKLLEIYVTRKDPRSFETQASELYSLTRGQGDEWAQAAAMGQALDPSNPLYSEGAAASGDDGSSMFAAPAAAAAGAAAFSAADFASDFNAPAPAPVPAAGGLDLDLGFDAPPAAGDNSMDFGSDMDTALPQAADASVSPASVAAESDNLMDFDLGGLSFEPTAAAPAPAEAPAAEPEALPEDAFNLAFDAPAAPAPAPAPAPEEDLSMDFGLDLPVEAAPAPAASSLPSASSDPLDLDLMNFEIPEVPAMPAPAPAAEAEIDDFALPEAEEVAPAPAPSAQEFDLSGIDLDLDSALGGAGTAAAADAAPGHVRDDNLSAHHMEMDTKLDLAIAYQEIGDKEGARELLDEVLRGGSDEQIAKANAMRAQLG
ncbi:FimV/HubP family polar landmark protein [Rugamonas aquatica]|uniref:LysM peptidoglycan-binding domain-containing protein n=1 Tax=Rugamonas aquatica TaxID=2743357 RepID=A0A6A7N9D4_9BURK|nr:FimV/HubP family polar landmark protein [Rugamonas aquatica]MQA41641.1 LysM peptidoglycan-binding domain-containing protein [Rugamonas aquatica]